MITYPQYMAMGTSPNLNKLYVCFDPGASSSSPTGSLDCMQLGRLLAVRRGLLRHARARCPFSPLNLQSDVLCLPRQR